MSDALSVLTSFLASIAIAAVIAEASQAVMHGLERRKALACSKRKNDRDR